MWGILMKSWNAYRGLKQSEFDELFSYSYEKEEKLKNGTLTDSELKLWHHNLIRDGELFGYTLLENRKTNNESIRFAKNWFLKKLDLVREELKRRRISLREAIFFTPYLSACDPLSNSGINKKLHKIKDIEMWDWLNPVYQGKLSICPKCNKIFPIYIDKCNKCGDKLRKLVHPFYCSSCKAFFSHREFLEKYYSPSTNKLKLLKCPFCGEYKVTIFWGWLDFYPHYECPKCKASLPKFYVEKKLSDFYKDPLRKSLESEKCPCEKYTLIEILSGIEKHLKDLRKREVYKYKDPEAYERVCFECSKFFELSKKNWWKQGFLCPKCQENYEKRRRRAKLKESS